MDEQHCHNCGQNLTLPPDAKLLYHTCTKMKTHHYKDANGKVQKIKHPEFGQQGPHILITDDVAA